MQNSGSLDLQSSLFRVIKSDPAKKVNRLEGSLAAVISYVEEVEIAEQTKNTTSMDLASPIGSYRSLTSFTRL